MKRRGKYNAKRITIDGITFDSQKEARRWAELQILEKAGTISGLRRQVRVDLMGQQAPMRTRTGRQMRITFDFAYTDGLALVYEDAKGYVTRDYEVRVAAARAMGLRIVES